ncbi:hypothetical protein HY412_00115 [Candidatus Kaiserbacteria bacterium]|nr:hypothetical protein [Candidatus Kaiserbacteria bacterium]
MADFVTFLVFCQALGASVGAVTTLWGEFAYIRAMRDGKIDVAERAHLDIIAKGLRFGMTLLLLASLGLVITAYTLHVAPQPALTPAYWILILLALLIIGISWALSRRHISFALGSAIIFTSWWFLSYLTLGWLPELSFGSAIALLVVATAIIYGLFHYLHVFTRIIHNPDSIDKN